MPEIEMTRTLNISAVRSQLSNLVNSVFRREGRVVIEKSGIPVAVIVTTDDADRLDRLDRQRWDDFSVIDEMREAFADIPEAELEAELERALRELRARRDLSPPSAV